MCIKQVIASKKVSSQKGIPKKDIKRGPRFDTRKGAIRFLFGMGCEDRDNCFACDKPDCTWDPKGNLRAKYMSYGEYQLFVGEIS